MPVRFADFEFDPASGELRRGDARSRLEPQPARVLALLTERAGAVVTREELQQRVWRDDTFVDFERGLNYCVAQIRAALGESASQPRFIETLPRRGYRFVAPVEPADAPVRAPSPGLAPSGGRRTTLLAGAACLLTAALAAGTWWLASRDSRIHIAVVPFSNETGVAEYDRLAQTLTDATVARLTNSSDDLAVVGNAAVLYRPRAFTDLMEIGDSLGVSYVVLGQVQEIAGQLRVNTHLIRIDDHSHMWVRRFEPQAADLILLDRQVPAAVAEAVVRRLLTRS